MKLYFDSKFSVYMYLIIFIFSSLACRKKHEHREPPKPFGLTNPEEVYNKQEWIAKVAMTLHGGHGLSQTQIDDLLPLSKNEIVDELMKDDVFGDTVVDFNLSYLGFKDDILKYPGQSFISYFFSKISYPSAITAAKEVMKDGDYFKLYDLEQPFYMSPIRTSIFIEDEEEEVDPRKALKTSKETMNEAVSLIRKNIEDEVDTNKFCEDLLRSGNKLYDVIDGIGLSYELVNDFRFSKQWFGPLVDFCYSDRQGPLPNFSPQLNLIGKNIDNFYTYLETFLPENYSIRTVSEVKSFDPSIAKLTLKGSMFTSSGFWQNIPNSSTNYNRKRASYVLKRFFCDDLTPINVALPSSHAEDKHASDPGCQACHYKLDPMAGFFRNIGDYGNSYEFSNEIYFDDEVSVDRKEYVSAWLGGPNSDIPWNIGYIRSATDYTLNDYTDHKENPGLEELMSIVKRAPEAKKCLVKNMFKYFVGEDLTIDAGYLDYLTEEFETKAKENSSLAFKETVKKLVTARTFSVKDPAMGECYDFKPGFNPEGAPPCKVSFILEKNCSSCHSGEGANGGLDLSSWVELEDGSYGFPHKKSGESISGPETFKRIVDRLTTDDLNLRMPLNAHIDAIEREQLYLWSLEILKKSEGR